MNRVGRVVDVDGADVIVDGGGVEGPYGSGTYF